MFRFFVQKQFSVEVRRASSDPPQEKGKCTFTVPCVVKLCEVYLIRVGDECYDTEVARFG